MLPEVALPLPGPAPSLSRYSPHLALVITARSVLTRRDLVTFLASSWCRHRNCRHHSVHNHRLWHAYGPRSDPDSLVGQRRPVCRTTSPRCRTSTPLRVLPARRQPQPPAALRVLDVYLQKAFSRKRLSAVLADPCTTSTVPPFRVAPCLAPVRNRPSTGPRARSSALSPRAGTVHSPSETGLLRTQSHSCASLATGELTSDLAQTI